MRILLTTLNAKYIHSSLALRYLEKYCQDRDYEVMIEEFTINDRIDQITAAIYQKEADVIGFSCYIWNISEILEIADRLKKVRPELRFILGGPEVSYDFLELMERYPFIDYIIRGEGEEPFKELLTRLAEKPIHLEKVPALVYRDIDGEIIVNNYGSNLKDVPRPYYPRELSKLDNKIIYYETSRGCPFNCSYCLSSTTRGVRYFSLKRVKEDLKLFVNEDVSLVKFVDRTFNASKERTMEIFRFLVGECSGRKTYPRFHFEVIGELFDQEMISFLKEVPPGLFQFEIGVQSTNPDTIRTIDRRMDFQRLADNVRQLKQAGNIHLHLDLIVGLPEENYITFKKSFDDVLKLDPDVLQLGFLKLLKGTKIRQEAEKYQYKFTTIPPYEVLGNCQLSYQDIIRLKGIEDILEKYYNSGVFKKSLNYIFSRLYNSPFEFFEDLAEYYAVKELDRVLHSRRSLYDIFREFYRQEIGEGLEEFTQYLSFDLLFNNRNTKIPDWANQIKIPLFKEKRYRFLKDESNIKRFMPHFQGLSTSRILGQVDFGVFNIDVLSEDITKGARKKTVILFDHEAGKAHDVTDFI